MRDSWNVFAGVEFIGVLIYDTDSKQFSFDLRNHTENGRKVFEYLNADKDQKRFKETLIDRVMPSNHVEVDKILRRNNMKGYDYWEIMKGCNLSNFTDNIWMTKSMNGEEYYEKTDIGIFEKLAKHGKLKSCKFS